MFTPLSAQKIDDIKKSPTPLMVTSVGSFYVGGRVVTRTAKEIGIYAAGPLTIDQMYVQYMIPQHRPMPPVVMIHGGTLSGKSFETTPDGRMGWFEYFARKGFPSYVVDQIGRARSGFDESPFNDVRTGTIPPSEQPSLRRVANDVSWIRFRFGPSFGVKFADTQFPVEAAGEFAKQSVPDLSQNNPDDPNYAAIAELARKLNGAVLIGHSQSGRFPFEAALLDSSGIKGLVAIEPAGCSGGVYTAAQIANLAKLPILIVFGDHLDAPQGAWPAWMPFFRDCERFVKRIKAARGNATMLHIPDLGIRGNSHMIMLDRNNLQIADLIMAWIAKQAGQPKRPALSRSPRRAFRSRAPEHRRA